MKAKMVEAGEVKLTVNEREFNVSDAVLLTGPKEPGDLGITVAIEGVIADPTGQLAFPGMLEGLEPINPQDLEAEPGDDEPCVFKMGCEFEHALPKGRLVSEPESLQIMQKLAGYFSHLMKEVLNEKETGGRIVVMAPGNQTIN